MEVEASPARDVVRTSSARISRIFPIHLVKCCPGSVQMLVPGTFAKIQDLTHLILVIGWISCLLLIVHVASKITSIMQFLSNPGYWFTLILHILFLLPVAKYMLGIINQYDDRLQSKQRDAQLKKESLTRSYNELLSDMDVLLNKSAESSAGLAERSFESKRRDFQRFLERAKSRYGNMYNGTKADTDQLLKQFRQFVVNWLAVFKECSIDPINKPKDVVTQEELNRCTSIVEVCDLCLERLRVTEVRFITVQRDQDQQILRNQRKELRRLTAGSEVARQASAKVPTNNLQIVEVGQRGRLGISWLTFGGGNGCRYVAGETEGYPAELRFVIGRLVLLSQQHTMLILCLLLGILIVIVELSPLANNGTHFPALPFVLLVEASICVMLVSFEELDVIQQLEREVRQLEKSAAHVEEQRERMREFWSNAQQLTELWLYRTVPRLDLYKELHSQLEDAQAEVLIKNITDANVILKDLDDRLGALADWRNNGTLSTDSKKQFGKAMANVCQEQEFDHVLQKVQDITNNGMKSLGNQPPTGSGSKPMALAPASRN